MEMLKTVQKIVWGPWLLGLFLAVGILCMLRLRGFPIRHIGVWWRETVGSGGRGQLLTTCTALAATVGTGNITGVAAALAVGGPGAVFWMWTAAFLGMALAYTEVYLGILYRGGPYAYLEDGAGSRFAGKSYALFCVLASLGMGCMVQARALADSLRYAASMPPLGTGIILAVLTAAVLFGGAKRIGQAASVLVLVSAGLYVLVGGIAVFSFYDRMPGILGGIVSGAFGVPENAGQMDGSSVLNFSGISGGMTGYGMAAAIRSGVSRGVFSNEAGLGSLAVLHGMSEKGEEKEKIRQKREEREIDTWKKENSKCEWEMGRKENDRKAQQQGMWAIFEVFFDTIIGCSLTAFLLLCVFPHNLTEKVDSLGASGVVAAALAVRFGSAGGVVTAACMVLLAFATILAWFYIGDQALGWLLRGVPEKRADLIRILYYGLYLASVFLGCVSRMEAAWAVSDIFNGLMAVPNLAALVVLGRQVRRPEHNKRPLQQ